MLNFFCSARDSWNPVCYTGKYFQIESWSKAESPTWVATERCPFRPSLSPFIFILKLRVWTSKPRGLATSSILAMISFGGFVLVNRVAPFFGSCSLIYIRMRAQLSSWFHFQSVQASPLSECFTFQSSILPGPLDYQVVMLELILTHLVTLESSSLVPLTDFLSFCTKHHRMKKHNIPWHNHIFISVSKRGVNPEICTLLLI